MSKRDRRRSALEVLREIWETLRELGPLVKPRELKRVPVRAPARRRR